MTAPWISPREAIGFALSVAGVRRSKVVTELVLLAIRKTGWKIVSDNTENVVTIDAPVWKLYQWRKAKMAGKKAP